MKLKAFFILLSITYWYAPIAQMNDTLVLSFSDFIKTVKNNHPVAKQSDLLVQSAEAKMLAAQGGFDPTLYYSIDQKQFDDQSYWTIQNGGVKIPTAVGLELSTGIEQSDGAYLNNESITSTDGMVYTQLTMPLLQGLLIDERRFAIKQAKLIKELSLIEQNVLLNELFSKASNTYWEWVQSYDNLQVIRESVSLAKQRLDGIKQSALLGDNAIIDTLEAGLQYQERSVTLQQQEMDFYTKSLLLSVFLWNENSEPYQIAASTIPAKSDELYASLALINMPNEMDTLLKTHPNILSFENRNSRLALELKLKQDKLKPILNVKFNPLYDVGNPYANIFNGVNSFKWAVGFQFPLLLRKERAEVKMAQLQLADLKYEQQSRKAEITNHLKASQNEYAATEIQVEQYDTVVKNYYQLLEAERVLFEIGESSIFMVNNREASYINSKLKLNQLKLKLRKAGVEMLYNSGQLYNQL